MIKETSLEIIFHFLFLVAISNSNTLRSSSFSLVENQKDSPQKTYETFFVQPEAF